MKEDKINEVLDSLERNKVKVILSILSFLVWVVLTGYLIEYFNPNLGLEMLRRGTKVLMICLLAALQLIISLFINKIIKKDLKNRRLLVMIIGVAIYRLFEKFTMVNFNAGLIDLGFMYIQSTTFYFWALITTGLIYSKIKRTIQKGK